MDIFDLDYYPSELSDWWMDNWITHVYGQNRTRKLSNVEVLHHMDATRYEIDGSHENMLSHLIEEGRKRVAAWQKVNHKL